MKKKAILKVPKKILSKFDDQPIKKKKVEKEEKVSEDALKDLSSSEEEEDITKPVPKTIPRRMSMRIRQQWKGYVSSGPP